MTKKMRLPGFLLVLALFLSSAVPTVTHAQKPAAAAVPDDADFAEFVKKATTKPEFLSPLVDHLPKKAGVPTPKDVLGYHIGTEKKLTYVADQQRYFRALEKALPGRVKTEVTGKTEEGRDIMVVFVTSEANLKNLEVNRQNTRQIADPRGLTDAQVQQLIATTKPHYHISAGLHSRRDQSARGVIELAYRLAVSEEPYIKQIRDNVIVSITGATDVDGRDRYVDWYYAYKIDEQYDGGENYGDVPYWGKYVFHDNNRDINYGVDSLRVASQLVSELGAADLARPARSADAALHVQRPAAAERESRSDPLHRAAVLRDLRGEQADVVRHARRVALRLRRHVVARLSRLCRRQSQRHAADVRDLQPGRRQHEEGAALGRADAARQWFRPNPAPAGEVDWSIRNSINYAQTGVLTALELTSKFPTMVVENYYKKSANAVKRGADKPPHAFVIPGGPARSDAGRSRRQPAAAAGDRSASRHRGDQGQGRHLPGRLVHRQAEPAVRPARQDAAREAELSRIRRSPPTTTARGRWGWRTTSRSRRSRTRRFSMRRRRC